MRYPSVKVPNAVPSSTLNLSPTLSFAASSSVTADAVNVILIGSPVLLVGLVFILLVELFRRRHYKLPADSKKRNNAEG